MNCLSWNITVHENSKEAKATHQVWGEKKWGKKGKVQMRVSLSHCIYPFQEPDQLLAVSQILSLTCFGNLLILTSASHPFSICLSLFSFKGQSLSLITCVYNSQNNGVLTSERSSEVTHQSQEILWQKTLPSGTAALYMACYKRVSQGHNGEERKQQHIHCPAEPGKKPCTGGESE